MQCFLVFCFCFRKNRRYADPTGVSWCPLDYTLDYWRSSRKTIFILGYPLWNRTVEKKSDMFLGVILTFFLFTFVRCKIRKNSNCQHNIIHFNPHICIFMNKIPQPFSQISNLSIFYCILNCVSSINCTNYRSCNGSTIVCSDIGGTYGEYTKYSIKPRTVPVTQ